MNKLAKIKFDGGGYGYQETDADGALIALYDSDGDQISSPSNTEWEHVADRGEIDPDDSDTFWDAIAVDQEAA